MDDSEKKLISQELESILKSFGNVAPNYLKLRDSYKFHLGTGVYDILRKEICKCLIFGLNQASITLTNHLLEKFLKLSLIFEYSGFKYLSDINSDAQKFEDASKLYMNKNLDTTINLACSKGIINKVEKGQLHVYRERLRNAYSHADTSKLFGNVEIPVWSSSLIDKGPITTTNVKVANMPILQGEAQEARAQRDALPYFLFIDGIICREEIKKYPEILSHNKKP